MTVRIVLAPKVDEKRDPCDADRHIDQSFAPDAPEWVRQDDAASENARQVASRTVGIFWKKRHGIHPFNVRLIDSCICANETMVSFTNQHLATHSDNALRFTQDDFD